jgi:hypothetical protein
VLKKPVSSPVFYSKPEFLVSTPIAHVQSE